MASLVQLRMLRRVCWLMSCFILFVSTVVGVCLGYFFLASRYFWGVMSGNLNPKEIWIPEIWSSFLSIYPLINQALTWVFGRSILVNIRIGRIVGLDADYKISRNLVVLQQVWCLDSCGLHHWASTQDLQLAGSLGDEWSRYRAGFIHVGISWWPSIFPCFIYTSSPEFKSFTWIFSYVSLLRHHLHGFKGCSMKIHNKV